LVYTKVSEREGGTREGHEGFANREVAWSDISRGMKREQPQTNDELPMQTFWRQWNARMTTPPASQKIHPVRSGKRRAA
jgi:hypothetical protein